MTSTPSWDPWNYSATSGYTANESVKFDGYKVAATDGDIGKVDEATYDIGGSYIVVDTGPWIFGRKVMIPAGVVQKVDHDDQKVYVSYTKDQIKESAELNEDEDWKEPDWEDPSYRTRMGDNYGRYYRGNAGL